MKSPFAILLSAILTLSGCAVQPYQHNYRAPAPEPCRPAVSPILNQTLVVTVSVKYTYTPKDQVGGRQWHQSDVLEYLNQLGHSYGDSFVPQNGQNMNFWFEYTVNNDGQDHFTGNLRFGGWGWGYVHDFNTQYGYTSTEQMFHDLTDQAFHYISGGWHDARTSCS
jgi:hypothetical protein